MGELIVNGIKMGLVIAAGAAFMVALTAILNLLGAILFGSVVGEVLGIISMCLPFSALTVFKSFAGVIAGIIAFLVAQKIYNLFMKSNEAI